MTEVVDALDGGVEVAVFCMAERLAKGSGNSATLSNSRRALPVTSGPARYSYTISTAG
jgi:hypothetical protein